MAERGDLAVVVVTLNALPYIEQCLQSVDGWPAVVVDHGSKDGTVGLVEEKFPNVRVVRQENVGLAAGWNRGIRETSSRFVLILNADAWAVGDGVRKLLAFAQSEPRAAVVGPKLLNTDGSLQRSVRGFPTLWRLATEYFFLRKLAPHSQALNAFYAGGFDHTRVAEAEFVMGAVMLVRREAIEQTGPLDEDFFLFSEETDWCFRFREAGWKVLFYPGSEFVHVGGASHGGRMFTENLRGHLRFLAKHRGPKEAERARRLLLAALRFRGVLFPGERGQMYRDAAGWLASGSAQALLAAPPA
jgi:GT2 family glycosyltransferase